MRRIATAAIGGLIALSSAGCSNKTSRLLAEVAWQLTCNGTTGGPTVCSASMYPGGVSPVYDFRGFHGDVVTDNLSAASLGLLEVECHAVDLGSGNIQLTVGTITDRSSFRIRGLNVDRTTGAYQPSACRATFTVEGISYGGNTQGVCSDQPPTAAAPCQIASITVDRNHPDGPSVDLAVFCAGLPSDANPSVKTSVRDSQDNTQPAFLHFGGCTGL